jgi:hypothetical protein
MKAEYDFSKGERGKFYNAQAEFMFPIYLEPDVSDKMNRLAEASGLEVQALINEWLRANLKLIESLHQAG